MQHCWKILSATLAGLGLAIAVARAQPADLVPVEELGLRIPPGFRVSLFADSPLANDIHCLTLNHRGDVVVSGPGYIKILHDLNGDGFADEFTLLAEPKTGAMGLCFDGPMLYAVVDGWLCRYADLNDDGIADGPAENILALRGGEHGGHAVRLGPDGWWYAIGGNDAGIGRAHASLDFSPVRLPEGGALLRVSPDGRESEILAHGFRNPYDFDFNWAGDLFTYDSDTERDYLLPWYSPTRLYHIGHAGHHGWRLSGYLRSWARPGYYADTIPTIYDVGRGSPTGVVIYRHQQFPEHFHEGLFVLDWTFGRVLHVPLEPEGASYAGEPEPFLEPMGNHGFAPTDAAVAPDGSLLISIGGRKTRGAVYRVEYVGLDATVRTNWNEWLSFDPLERALRAPQPLEAWSRATWAPIAHNLGEDAFGRVAAAEHREPADRIRAIEILTGTLAGLSFREANAAARAAAPEVRARVAWSLGRQPCPGFTELLVMLADDPHPLPRRCALEALGDRYLDLDQLDLVPIIRASLDHADKRVRLAAARLAALLPTGAWDRLTKTVAAAPASSRLTAALAAAGRLLPVEVKTNVIETALGAWKETRDPALRLDAVRLIILALGDYRLEKPSLEAYTGYELALAHQTSAALSSRIRSALRPWFPSSDLLLDVELSRLLAMLGDDDYRLARQVAREFTPKTTATLDFHYLTVLSRLRAPRSSEMTRATAKALVGLDRKLEQQNLRLKQNWGARLTEVAGQLLKKDPALAEDLLRQPDFAREGNLPLATLLAGAQRQRAALLFLQAAARKPDWVWSPEFFELLGHLPFEQTEELFRRLSLNPAWRDEAVLKLARQPRQMDRERFVAALETPRLEVAAASVKALLELPPDDSPKNLAPLLRLLDRLTAVPEKKALRAEVVALFNRQTGQKLATKEGDLTPQKLKALYEPVQKWFVAAHPQYAAEAAGTEQDDPLLLARLLARVDWTKGDARRGGFLFHERGCAACHSGPATLGPDLAGVTSRFGMSDLFQEIAQPSRNIAEAYRTTEFRLKNGTVHTGLVVFFSADGCLVQTDAASTLRLAADEVLYQRPGTVSLMPSGLLQGMQPADLADLYAYLKSLAGQSAPVAKPAVSKLPMPPKTR